MLVLKDVLRPHLKPGSSGGGKSSSQTSTLQTAMCFIQVDRRTLKYLIEQILNLGVPL